MLELLEEIEMEGLVGFKLWHDPLRQPQHTWNNYMTDWNHVDSKTPHQPGIS